MKLYTLNIDTDKPITQRLAIPKDVSEYGIVVKSTTNGHPTRNATATIYDGNTTITPTRTLEDGSQLFVMSSIGSASRTVKVGVTATPSVLAEGGTFENDTDRVKIQTINLPFSVGTYWKDEVDLFGYLYNPAYDPLALTSGPGGFIQIKTANGQIDYVNADSWLWYPYERILYWCDRKTASQVLGEYLPPHDPMVVNTDVTFPVKIRLPAQSTVTILDTTLGNPVNCVVDVQLDERTVAFPDGEIEYTPELTDSTGAKHETKWQTITIDGTDYKVLTAKSEEA